MLVLHLPMQYKNMVFEQKGTSLVHKYGSVCERITFLSTEGSR